MCIKLNNQTITLSLLFEVMLCRVITNTTKFKSMLLFCLVGKELALEVKLKRASDIPLVLVAHMNIHDTKQLLWNGGKQLFEIYPHDLRCNQLLHIHIHSVKLLAKYLITLGHVICNISLTLLIFHIILGSTLLALQRRHISLD